jgi:hypothetical protein
MGIAADGNRVFFVTGYVDDPCTVQFPSSLFSVTGVEQATMVEASLPVGRSTSAPSKRLLLTSASIHRLAYFPNRITLSHLSIIISMGAIEISGLQELLSLILSPFLEVVSLDWPLQEARVAKYMS